MHLLILQSNVDNRTGEHVLNHGHTDALLGSLQTNQAQKNCQSVNILLHFLKALLYSIKRSAAPAQLYKGAGREGGAGGGGCLSCHLTEGRGCPSTKTIRHHKQTYRLKFEKNEKRKWQICYPGGKSTPNVWCFSCAKINQKMIITEHGKMPLSCECGDSLPLRYTPLSCDLPPCPERLPAPLAQQSKQAAQSGQWRSMDSYQLQQKY